MEATISDEELGFHEGMDKGDETALGAFSDWLQERDDPRATGYQFLWDKREIPELPGKTTVPWNNSSSFTLRKLMDWLSVEKQFALKLACVLSAIRDAESVLPILELAYPNETRPRQVIETTKQWTVAPTDVSVNVLQAWATTMAAVSSALFVVSVASASAYSAIDTVYSAAAAAASGVSEAAGHTAAASFSCAFAARSSYTDSYPAEASRWCWTCCVFRHIALIPVEYANKFARSVPLRLGTTRREITDAFAMAFVGSP